ncbi:hypothetical protein E1193_27025 [Micromonospora sp. KC606]|uniref:hypothetical protein n=1 Tax=Micromonospora sp. KC606 TaxID=2530379 RepID=UPI001046399B|nr:hypothetical protein [Micromonospora sp. KC606]TDC72776.1 hypothetical protein E1193_27025 [Micromonospora sp. KC606]
MVIPVLTLAVVACGAEKGSDIPTANGGGSGATAAASLSAEERQQRALKFVECMREQGIDMPDPDPETGGVGMEFDDSTEDKMKAASEACRQYMPSEGEARTRSAEDTENLRKFAQCMREHGLDEFPDPGPDGLSLDGTGLDPKDAAFKAAEEACKDLRPKAPGSGS